MEAICVAMYTAMYGFLVSVGTTGNWSWSFLFTSDSHKPCMGFLSATATRVYTINIEPNILVMTP